MNFLISIPFSLQITAILFLGLILGSFVNVCIHRLPKKESIIFPGSHCISCNEPISAWDNIPIFSYLLLNGKCRQCTKPISAIYPINESITALLLLVGFLKLGISIKFLIFCIIAPTLLTISIIDIKHKIIPDIITIPGILFGLIAGSYLVGLKDSSLGLIVGGSTFLIISEIYYRIRGRVGMGGGDIKFIAAAGALLGIQQVILIIFISSFMGSFVGLAGLAGKKFNALSQIPFGPFLSGGTLIVYFWGEQIIQIYIMNITGRY
jgi:leader peptidase (prepilin peptidase)/N-methyltransferase